MSVGYVGDVYAFVVERRVDEDAVLCVFAVDETRSFSVGLWCFKREYTR
jgi:hypothetical protein